MTRSRDTADTQDNLGGAVAPFVGAKNFTINGNFDWWQRGTSFTTDNAATVIYTADRWGARALFPNSGAVQTITQETSNVPVGSKYSLKSVIATAAAVNNTRMQVFYTLEHSEAMLLAGKTMTLSVQAKGIGNIDTLIMSSTYNTAGGKACDGTTIVSANKTINTSTFTTCSITFTVPNAATLTSTGTLGFLFVYTRSSGAAEQVGDGFFISQVQLEVGNVQTQFSRAGGSIGGELALCQRYYYRLTADTTYAYLAFGMATSTTNGKVSVPAPSTMRVVPTAIDSPTASTLRFTDGVTGTTCNSSPTLDGDVTNELLTFNIGVASGLTQYRSIWFGANNSSSAYVGFSAEL